MCLNVISVPPCFIHLEHLKILVTADLSLSILPNDATNTFCHENTVLVRHVINGSGSSQNFGSLNVILNYIFFKPHITITILCIHN